MASQAQFPFGNAPRSPLQTIIASLKSHKKTSQDLEPELCFENQPGFYLGFRARTLVGGLTRILSQNLNWKTKRNFILDLEPELKNDIRCQMSD